MKNLVVVQEITIEDKDFATLVSNILLDKMSKGIAEFEFIKKDGTHRHAFGTRVNNLVRNHVKGGKAPNGVIPFWDVEIGEWRSVDPEKVTHIWEYPNPKLDSLF